MLFSYYSIVHAGFSTGIFICREYLQAADPVLTAFFARHLLRSIYSVSHEEDIVK